MPPLTPHCTVLVAQSSPNPSPERKGKESPERKGKMVQHHMLALQNIAEARNKCTIRTYTVALSADIRSKCSDRGKSMMQDRKRITCT